MNIWRACDGDAHIHPVSGTLFRLVESQEQIATLGYVDNLEEQTLLEEMLDAAKPRYPDKSSKFHYLLKTPFRYPPLKWGSRFGGIHEPSIFYGGGSAFTTLAESAYYRFVFWYSMGKPPVKKHIRSEHTLFSVAYKNDRGVSLHTLPFDQYRDTLRHPANYHNTQQLGSDMRQAGVEVFEYLSARDPHRGCCIGLFSLSGFRHRKPSDSSQWLCELGAGEVAFKQFGQRECTRFPLDIFLVDGHLPYPA